MKNTTLLKLSAACAALFAAACSRVDNSGTDLQALIDAAAKTPEKKLVLRGIYSVDKPLKISSAHSGLKIKGKSGATISGGKLVEGWAADGELLKARVDFDDVEALFVNGERRVVAQTEEVVYMYSKADKDWLYNGKPVKNLDSSAFKMRNEDLAFFDGLTKEQIQNSYLDIYEVWYNNKVRVLDIVKNPDSKTSTVLVENTMATPFYRWETAPRFKICNAFKALDKPGEFYFDKTSKTLYYRPMKGETADNIKAYYPVVDSILDIFGDSPENPVRDVEIDGVAFEYGARRPGAGWKQSGQGATTTRGFIRVEFARGVSLSNCEVRHTNGYAIAFYSGSQNCEVEDSHLWDLGAGGVKITEHSSSDIYGIHTSDESNGNRQTNHIEIKNNIINAYGRFDKAGIGVISMKCGDITIDHNTIFDGYYSGVSTGWTWGFAKTNTKNLRITNNKIFSLGHGLLCDMGGIYTLGDSRGSEISGNEIFGVRRHRYGGWGIYNDEGSQGFLITKNYVHDTEEDGYFMHYGENCTVKNNVFANAETSQIGLGGRMFMGLKGWEGKAGGRKDLTLKDGFKFENNIVVYKSPARLLREKRPIPTNLAFFDNNMYWNYAGEVTFADLSFEKWKGDFKQDLNSIIADPKLDGTTPKNDAYKKIGFEPFSVKDAGVEGDMKAKFQALIKDYKFPPLVKNPRQAPWKEKK